MAEPKMTQCPRCEGTGQEPVKKALKVRVAPNTCSGCAGSGLVRE